MIGKLGQVLVAVMFLFSSSVWPYTALPQSSDLVRLVGLDLTVKGQLGFILSDDKVVDKDYLKSHPLKYFFTALLVPNDHLWANLSPDLTDWQIVGPGINNTDLGRLLLHYDVMLKEDVQNLLSLYVDDLEDYAYRVGIERLRFWIEPGVVRVRLDERKAKIESAPLRVRVEVKGEGAEEIAGWLERTIVPELEKRINTSPDYARLRQAHYSLVLAQWYKRWAREDMPFVDYIDSLAKGEGIVSDVVWFRSAYLEKYARLYFNNEISGITFGFAVGGVKEEVPDGYWQTDEGNIPDSSGIRVKKEEGQERDRERGGVNFLLSEDVKEEILKAWQGEGKEVEAVIIRYPDNQVGVQKWNPEWAYPGRPIVIVKVSKRTIRFVSNLGLGQKKEAEELVKILKERLEKETGGRQGAQKWASVSKNRGKAELLLTDVIEKAYDVYAGKRQGEKIILFFPYTEDEAGRGKIMFSDVSRTGEKGQIGFYVMVKKGEIKVLKGNKIPSVANAEDLSNGIVLWLQRKFRKLEESGKDLGVEQGRQSALAPFEEEKEGDLRLLARAVYEGRSEEKKITLYLAVNRYINLDLQYFLSNPEKMWFFVDPEANNLTRFPIVKVEISEGRIELESSLAYGSDYAVTGLKTTQIVDSISKLLGLERNPYWERRERVHKDSFVNFALGVDEAIVEALNGGRELDIVLVPRGDGSILVRRYVEGEALPFGASVVRVNQDGFGPSYRIGDRGSGNVVQRFDNQTWEMLRKLREALVFVVRDMESMKDFLDKMMEVKSPEELVEKGIPNEEIRSALDSLLNYTGDRDVYVWIWKSGSEYNLRFQFHRPIRYYPSQENHALIRFNHLSGQAEVIREGSLKEEDIYRFIGAIKRAMLKKEVISEIGIRGDEGTGRWVVGKEIFLEDGQDILFRFGNQIWRLRRNGKKVEVYVGAQKVKTLSAGNPRVAFSVTGEERVFLPRAKEDMGVEIEMGRDGFIRIFVERKDVSLKVGEWNKIQGKGSRSKTFEVDGEKYLVLLKGVNAFIIHETKGVVYRGSRKDLESGVWLEGDLKAVGGDWRRAKYHLSIEGDSVILYSFSPKSVSAVSRDIVYWDREKNVVSELRRATDFDGFIKTKKTDEYIIVDWNRDERLRELYEEIVGDVISWLGEESEESGLRLNGELADLESALLRNDRTMVEEIMQEVDGTLKGQLIEKVYEAIREKVPYQEVGRGRDVLLFIGDTVGDKGVCRHTAVLANAILDRFSKVGFLSGRVYYIGIPGHGFSVYVTSAGEPIVLDVAQTKFIRINSRSEERAVGIWFDPLKGDFVPREVLYKDVLKGVGFDIPRENNYNGFNTLPLREIRGQMGNRVWVTISSDLDSEGLPEGADEVLQIEDVKTGERTKVGIKRIEDVQGKVRSSLESLREKGSGLAEILLDNWTVVEDSLTFYEMLDEEKEEAKKARDLLGYGGNGKVVLSSALLKQSSKEVAGLAWAHEILEALVDMGLAKIELKDGKIYLQIGSSTKEFSVKSEEALRDILFEKVLAQNRSLTHYLIYEAEKSDVEEISTELTNNIRAVKQERGIVQNDGRLNREEIHVQFNNAMLPAELKEALFRAFVSGRLSEGALFDVVRALYYGNTIFFGLEDSGEIFSKEELDEIKRGIEDRLGFSEGHSFEREWERVMEEKNDTIRILKLLGLLNKYKVYAWDNSHLYDRVLQRAVREFKRVLDKEVGKITRLDSRTGKAISSQITGRSVRDLRYIPTLDQAIEALGYFSSGVGYSNSDLGKGGLVFSLNSLIVF